MGIGKEEDKFMSFEALRDEKVDDIDGSSILVVEEEGGDMVYKFFIFHFDLQTNIINVNNNNYCLNYQW